MDSPLHEIIDLSYLESLENNRSGSKTAELAWPNLMTDQTGNISNSSKEIEILKQRLDTIKHVMTCINTTCIAEMCQKVKNLMRTHISYCSSGILCNEEGCNSIKNLLEHQRNCYRFRCVLCSRNKTDDHDYSYQTLPTPNPYQRAIETYTRFNSSYQMPFLNNHPVNLKISKAFSLHPSTSSETISSNHSIPSTSTSAEKDLKSEDLSLPTTISHISQARAVPSTSTNVHGNFQSQVLPSKDSSASQVSTLTQTAPSTSTLAQENSQVLRSRPSSSQVLFPRLYLAPIELLTSSAVPSSTTSMTSNQNLDSSRTCARCRTHGFIRPLKGHRNACPFTLCSCMRCKTINRSRTTRSQTMVTQAEKRAAEASDVTSPIKIDRSESSRDAVELDAMNSIDTVNENGIIWKKFDAKIPETALVFAGKDADESAVYVGRVYFESNLIPAKLSMKNKNFEMSFNNIKQTYYYGEMLIDSSYSWKKINDGVVPKNAIFGGLMSDGTNLLIGKIFHEESMLVGRVSVDGVLYACHKGKEMTFKAFDILVKDDGGKCSDSMAPTHQCTLCFEDAPIVGIFMDCGHACLCNDCISIINAKKNKNGKVNCLICTRECYMARKIHFA